MFRFDPMARILDSHSNFVPDRLQADSHGASRRRVVQRIVEQIDQRLLDPLCIAENGWDRLGFNRQCNSAVVGKRGQFIYQILNQGLQGEWHEVNGRLTACEIREGQQGMGQGNAPPDLLKIIDEGFAIFLRGPGFHEGDIQVALQDGQGGAFHGRQCRKISAEFHHSVGTDP